MSLICKKGRKGEKEGKLPWIENEVDAEKPSVIVNVRKFDIESETRYLIELDAE